MQHDGIIPREEENYEHDTPAIKSDGLKSIRRRAFRNRPWSFEKPLKFPGVETYLRRAFSELHVIDATYRLVGNRMAGDLKHRLRHMGFINRAEVYAHVLALPGLEAYLRQ